MCKYVDNKQSQFKLVLCEFLAKRVSYNTILASKFHLVLFFQFWHIAVPDRTNDDRIACLWVSATSNLPPASGHKQSGREEIILTLFLVSDIGLMSFQDN